MTTRDFAYWLQGYFELENPSELDTKTTIVIKKHLDLVYKYELDKNSIKPNLQDSTSKRFVISLMGFFDIYNPQNINEKELQTIKNKLNIVFKHEIDPSYGDEQAQHMMNFIHGSGPNDENMRC